MVRLGMLHFTAAIALPALLTIAFALWGHTMYYLCTIVALNSF